ncbi:MAG: hypothetical protein ABI878_14900 [Acidobacteriota bacterium]
MKIVLFLSMILTLSVAASAQSPVAPVAVQELYLAKDDGNGRAGEAATAFVITDIPIYCVVQLDSTSSVTVKMNLVAAKVPGVKEETKVVTVSYTTKDGQNRVNFTGKPDGKWVAGNYRVDIFIDGKAAKELTFEIKNSSARVVTAELFQPADPKPKPAVRRKKN